MTDLKPALNSIITTSHAASLLPDESTLTSRRIDSFLEEARRINTSISSLLTSLRRFRAAYLSTAPPPRNKSSTATSSTVYFTASDRETFDTETTAQLRSFNALLANFRQVESVRQETVQLSLQKKYGRSGGALWRWAAGGAGGDRGLPKSAQHSEDEGRAHALKTVRESVLWYLGKRLKEAGELYREMFEIRVDREREKEKSVLWKTGGRPFPQGMNGAVKGISTGRTNEQLPGSTTTTTMAATDRPYHSSATASNPNLRPYDAALSADESKHIEATLTPEQLQLFATENSALLSHYDAQLTRVTQAEKSLLEIADLQNQLVGHLDTQAEMIGQLVDDAAGTEGNLERGNRELKRAGERRSTARMVYYGTVGICAFCVVWDLIF